jgi:hypothetical protein
MAHTELRRSVLPLALFATVGFAATGYGHSSSPPPSSSNEGHQIGKILSVRKVLANRYFGSRYPQTHYYLLYFAFARPTRHIALSTKPVLDEIDDLIGSGLWPTKGKGGQRQKSNLQNESAMDSTITLSPRVTGSLKNSGQTMRLAALVCESHCP